MPGSFSQNGTFANVRKELGDVAAAMPAADFGRDRAVLRGMLDRLDGVAGDDDTVNASFNYAVGTTGQIDMTATVSVTRRPAIVADPAQQESPPPALIGDSGTPPA